MNKTLITLACLSAFALAQTATAQSATVSNGKATISKSTGKTSKAKKKTTRKKTSAKKPAAAAAQTNTDDVQQIKGRISGEQTADYPLNLQEGQTLTVKLTTPHTSTHYLLMPPAGEEVLHNSALDGNQYQGVTKQNGKYRVQVYMLQSAAKNHETAPYDLTITTSKPAPKADPAMPPPADNRDISGSITGEQSSEYPLSIKQGQAMNITLTSANKNAHFNLLPPKGEDAVHNGTVSGDQYTGVAKQSGEYRVRVYLLNAAAKRGETAKYHLKISTGQ